MPTKVVMPQMGESIFEGTITKWLKKVGDTVQKDEPLLEISTDKVDAEIPAPVAGVLTEIMAQEGETVGVNTAIATIASHEGAMASRQAPPPEDGETPPSPHVARASVPGRLHAHSAPPPEDGETPPSPHVARASVPGQLHAHSAPPPEDGETPPSPHVARASVPGQLHAHSAPPPEDGETPPSPHVVRASVPGQLHAHSAPPPEDGETPPSPHVVRAGVPSGGGTPSRGVEVAMPQMGESIFEGTITKWLKKAGDAVQKDEPLFEISTDKVDAEIPAPVAGILTEVRVHEGETVEVNTVVAIIGGPAAVAQPDGSPAGEARSVPPSPAAMPGPAPEVTPAPEYLAAEEPRSSPLVRRIAREHRIDLRRVPGTGSSGRISKDDILNYIQRGAAAPQSVTPPVVTTLQPQRQSAPALEGKVEPMSRMRSIIAQRMVESSHAIPHAYTIYKIDMTRVARLRQRARADFERRHGVKLTYMPFIAAAAVDALRRYPIVNAALADNAIRYHQNIHLGIAVALEWGLIVPVVREAERCSFAELAKAIAGLAERARTKKLKPEEASGSTFTLTNSGVFGGEFGTPIINQPESAILAIGGLKKEAVVLPDAEGNDTIAIRSMQTYCLGFDHRLIDGGDAGKFMTAMKDALENWTQDIG